ncbi:MAG: hypothetical protein AMXMBFR7_01050 [Planctomycetota bacterium]
MADDEKQGRPILATMVGCAGLLFIPVLLLGVIGYSGWRLWGPPSDSGAPKPPASGTAGNAGRFSAEEEIYVRALIERLGIEDPAANRKAWSDLQPFHRRDRDRVRQLMLEALARATNPLLLRSLVWGLCRYYDEAGRAGMLQIAGQRRNQPQVIDAMRSGIVSLADSDAALGNQMLQRFDQAVGRTGAQPADPRDEY